VTPLSQLADDWPAINQLLDEALALAPDQRQDWLAALPSPHAALKDTLAGLLSALYGVETGDFLEALPRVGTLALSGAGGEAVAGDLVGPWRLLRELGVGGMGSVWLAERADGRLKRQVALKLPRLDWTGGLAERMARERDILAMLEHPRIARLYDAGLDTMGRPYLALEYVEGLPIDRFAADRGLGVHQRLDLLLQVADAVAHAHSRLVVRRDLKPSNVLVTTDGQVRLLDFGIAKLIEGDAAPETALTRVSGRALTLDYASPEQIAGRPITTGSDVYSLAVVAYELLSGARPYRLKRGSAAELEEAIASADVPRASVSAGDPSTRRALRGDLDAILHKALKKNPADRYPTVDALALDLRRHLANEPVSAQPDALAYRAGKFLRRYKLQVGAGAAVLGTLAAGVGVAWSLALTADQERAVAVQAQQRADTSAGEARGMAQLAQRRLDEAQAATTRATAAAAEAERQRQRALGAAAQAESERQRAIEAADRERRASVEAAEQARRAEGVKTFLSGIFETGSVENPDGVQARSRTVGQLIEDSAARVLTELDDTPRVKLDLLRTLGTIAGGLDLGETSEKLLTADIALSQRLGEPPAVMAERHLARHAMFAGRRLGSQARLELQAALAQARQVPGDAGRFLQGRVQGALARDLGVGSLFRDGRAELEQAIALLAPAHADSLAYLDTQNLLGQRLVYADGQATRGLALLRTTADAIDAHPQSRPSDRHRARLDLAVALYRAQQPQEALHEIDRLVAALAASHEPRSLFALQVHNERIVMLSGASQRERATPPHWKAADLAAPLRSAAGQRRHSEFKRLAGLLAPDVGRFGEARRLVTEGAQAVRAFDPPEPVLLMTALAQAGRVLMWCGDYRGAQALLAEAQALSLQHRPVGAYLTLGEIRFLRAESLLWDGQMPEADAVIRQLLAAAPEEGHARRTVRRLGRLLHAHRQALLGDVSAAAAGLRTLIDEVPPPWNGDDRSIVIEARHRLAFVLARSDPAAARAQMAALREVLRGINLERGLRWVSLDALEARLSDRTTDLDKQAGELAPHLRDPDFRPLRR